MSSFEEIGQAMSQAILDGDEETAAAVAQQALDANIEPTQIFEEVIVPTLQDVGDRFSRLEIFLPEMMMAADATKAVFAVLEPAIKDDKSGLKKYGTVVIGTVAGDVHDIGKDMVATLLEVSGFEVINLGCDVPPAAFLKTAQEKDADIIAMSSLLTTSLPYMKDLLAMVKESGQGDRFKIMVGGGPVTVDWVNEVGADGYGRDATDAVRVARELVAA